MSSNVNRAARSSGLTHRYDVVLDLCPPDGEPLRLRVDDVELGEMLPELGSTVLVMLGRDADGRLSAEILWRGDPNLDLAARRQEMARLADLARARRETDER